MPAHSFGGDWTEQKLEKLKEYLKAYALIFDRNTGARYYKTRYIDAFAGTGKRVNPKRATTEDKGGLLFAEEIDEFFDTEVYGEEGEHEAFFEGSAQIALGIDPPFDSYIFIEKSPSKAKELESLKMDHPHLANSIQIRQGDANTHLQALCGEDWSKHRAVVFLDPYGMQVKWATLEAIAKTQAIDMWILVPIGMGAVRMMKKVGHPRASWAATLDGFFGTSDWRNFYKPKPEADHVPAQGSLFDDLAEETEPRIEDPLLVRDGDFDSISKFFTDRLGQIFSGVAPNTLILRNHHNTPMYLLCFASSNPKGAPTAIKIANYLIGKIKK